MIDFHSHVLPGIDDGSPDTATSLKMLEIWRTQDIRYVCATPHFNANHTDPERFLLRRSESAARLTSAGGLGPSVILGAEVRFYEGMSMSKSLPKLCIEGTDFLLLEMPFSRWTDRMLQEATALKRKGIVPVLAHVERYIGLNSLSLIQSLADNGFLIQCNAEFFLDRRTQRRALAMLRRGYVHCLGSDAHDDLLRAPDIGPAADLIKQKLGPGYVDILSSLDDLIIPSGKDPLA